MIGGSSGSIPQNAPDKACDFGGLNSKIAQSRPPAQDDLNPKIRVTKTETSYEAMFSPNPVSAASGFPSVNLNQGGIPSPVPMHWLLPNGMIDACPVFTPNTYQNWRIEAKLRRTAQVGAGQTQLISKIATALPLNIRMEALAYLESTESNIDSRSVNAVLQILNARYGKTDPERAWDRLSSFAEFKRGSGEITKISG